MTHPELIKELHRMGWINADGSALTAAQCKEWVHAMFLDIKREIELKRGKLVDKS